LADGWVKIFLNPHLINGRLEIWDQSYGGDLYIGKLINPGWMGTGDPSTEPYYMSGSPFPSSHIYRIKFPRQQIDGIWYKSTQLPYGFTFQSTIEETIPITPEPTNPVASIIELNLPSQLHVGEPITGSIKIQNVGDSVGDLRCLIITEWNGAIYSTEQSLNSGQILEATLPVGVVMPAQDAVITIKGEHLEGEVWVTDDVKTH